MQGSATPEFGRKSWMVTKIVTGGFLLERKGAWWPLAVFKIVVSRSARLWSRSIRLSATTTLTILVGLQIEFSAQN